MAGRLPDNVRMDYKKQETKIRKLIEDKPLFREYFKYNYSNIESHRINIRSIKEYISVQIKFFDYATKIFNFDFMSHEPVDARLELIEYGFVDEFIDYINGKRKDNEHILTQETQNTYIISVNSFFNWALEFDYIAKNHIKKSIIKIKKKKKLGVALTDDEVHALLDLSTHGYTTINEHQVSLNKHELRYFEKNYLRNNTFIILMLFLGLRLAEVTQLNNNSINYNKEILTVVRKGEEIDELPLSKSLIKVLKKYNESKSAIEKQSPALFNSFYRNEYKRLTSRQIAKVLNKYLDMISEPGTYSPHKLRSTLATKLLSEGHDVFHVSIVLNHHSINTTKIYLKENEQTKRSMLGKVKY